MAIADLEPASGWSGARQHFGRYHALRQLAVGGMAELILAEATRPGDFRKVVAIKRLLPQHARDPQVRQMFLDEARLMARMSHPHIPQVYDVCEVEDPSAGANAAPTPEAAPDTAPFDVSGAELGRQLPYFIMEYVHGRDLRAVMTQANGPLPIATVVTIGTAVAAGLHHAHELRAEGGDLLEVVHRDVSPSNVLVSFDGVVKLTDFGVAKWRQQRSLTVQGQLKGKLAHMSPEQCFGHALDRRSDVFALGTLLYEMAFGQPAFAAESDYELMSRIVRGEARVPEGARTRVPAPLVEVIVRCLARSRDERPPTAQAVQVELERLGRAHQLSSSPLDTATYLESLFGARVSEWRAAMHSGRSLAEHLRDQAVASPPRVPAPGDRTLTDGAAGAAAATHPADPKSGADAGKGAVRDQPLRSAGSVAIGKPRSVVAAGIAVAAGVAGLTMVIVRSQPKGTTRRVQVATLGAPGTGLRRAAGVEPAQRSSGGFVPGARAAPVTSSSTSAPVHDGTSPRSGLARERRPAPAPPRRGPARAVSDEALVALRRPTAASVATNQVNGGRAAGVPEAEAARAVEIPTSPRTEVKVWDPDSPVPP